MKTICKTLAILLAAAIMLGVAPFAPMIAPPAAAVVAFTDIGGHWAQADIRRLNELGALEDFAPGKFRPNDPITRAEFFSLVVRTLKATVRGDISRFTDVSKDDWFYNNVAIAVNMGIANGYDDNTMRPNNSLIRQDAATLVARALGMSSKNELVISRFSDYSAVSQYAKTFVSAFVEKSLLSGYPNGTLQPLKTITRAEAVKLISNIFPNVHMPESTLVNVSLRGGLLVTTPFAELRDVVLNGDVVVGDGVGSGSVLLSNCTIFGSLIVRGGGPNSVALSNTYVDRIYVASYGADTRVAVDDKSIVPEVEAASSFTLSGRGATDLTILDQAREGSSVKLDGISLDNLHIGGRASKVSMSSGRALNARFDGAGQDSSLDINESSSVENLTVAVPNVKVTGKGGIHSLLVNNTGASIEKTPDFTTVGVNFTATIGGSIVSGPQSTTPSAVDRVKNTSLNVTLLSSTAVGAPFDQSALRVETKEGRSATDVSVTQKASGRVPLTAQRNRLAYWVGFFIPAPNSADIAAAALTYTYADADPVTVRRNLDTVSSRRGLTVYLPVFRKPGSETGQLKETLYINWGGNVTENIQFESTALSLSPLTASGKQTLERDFNGNYDDGRGSRFYSVNGSTVYFGAEAVRRILNSDNPLGLPSTGNKGLDAINRALSSNEARSVLEEPSFAADLTVNTSQNSPYSKLSNRGKLVVAEAVLAARKTSFATPSAVKAAFDKAVDARMMAESSLLSKINGSGDYAALRKTIETAANAAILDFQTGADPYKSYTNAQKDDMAKYLFNKIPYPSIEAVISAIKDYLGRNPLPEKPGPDDVTVKTVTANPSKIPTAPNATPFAVGNERVVKLTVVTTDNKTLTPDVIAAIGVNAAWRTDSTNPIASVAVKDDKITLHALRVGNDTLEITVGGKTATVAVSVVAPINATGVAVTPKSASIIVGATQTLVATMTPANATDTIKWSSSNPAVATVDNETGIVTGTGSGVVTITAQTLLGYTDSSQIRVFRDVNDVVVDPSSVILTPGAYTYVTAYTYAPNRNLTWDTDDSKTASAANAGRDTTDSRIHTGRISAPTTALANGLTEAAATITLTVEGSDPDNNDGSGRQTVSVTVKANNDVNVWLEKGAVMFSGQTQQIFIKPEDKTLQNQKYYIKIDGGAGGSKAAQCINGERTPVGANDKIEIKANDDGVGVVTIGVYTNPEHTGDRVGPELTVIISPKGIDGIDFNHTGTSVKIPNTNTVKYPAGPLPQDTDDRGQILEMKLADSTTVTPMLTQGSTRVPLTQPITWSSYVANHNRMIMYEVKTSVEVSGSQRTYYLLQKDGTRIAKKTGGFYTFADIFDVDVDNAPYDTSADADGSLVSRYGFFKRALDKDDDTRLLIMRVADMNHENSRLLGVSGGAGNTGILAPSYDEPTGLAAVALTPARVQINNEMEREQWYDLYYDTTKLVKDGEINPIIAPESRYLLQKRSGPGSPWVDVPDMYSETNITSDTHRVLDANGVEVSLTGYVPVLRFGDPYAEHNIFYVRILPNDLARPAAKAETYPWEAPKNPPPGNVADPDLWGQVEFKPGSKDKYILYTQNDPNLPTTPIDVQNPAKFPYQRASSLPGGTTSPQDITIVPLGSSLFVSIPVIYPNAPPIKDIVYFYQIEQYSKLGFSTLKSELNRQSAYSSSTGYPALTYTLTLTPPQTAMELDRDIYLASDTSISSTDKAWDKLYFLALQTACNLAGIDMVTAKVEKQPTNTAPIGDVAFDGTGLNRRVIGTVLGSIRVVITSSTDPSKSVSVRYAVKNPPAGWDGTYPIVTAFSVGDSMPATDIPEVVVSAFSAGIDLDDATVESDTPTLLTIDGRGIATARRSGRAKVTVRSRNGAKSASATIDILPAGGTSPGSGGGQSVSPASEITEIKLRGEAAVAIGKTITLVPYITPYDADKSGIAWTSSDASVATVSGGAVTGVKSGSATITAADASGAVTASCKVTVKANSKPVTAMTPGRKTVSIAVGASTALSVVFKPANATFQGMSWRSDNESVARVDPSGRVTAIAPGTATITATSDSGGKTAQFAVTVTQPSQSGAGAVALPESAITLKVGAKYQLQPTQTPPDPSVKKFVYSTKASAIASVSSTGLITAKKPGTTVITVKAGSQTATCTVTVVK